MAVEVVGRGTTAYTLDYAAGNRILAEETDTGSTLYLYGRDCLGEHRDDEWLYYLNDAEGLVRQGADEQGQVVSGWLFDPDGTVLEGPEGPVSHLVCGGIYDWSTGLIYRDGRYFDPMLGIWLALAPLVVVQSWRGRKKKRRGFPWYVVVLFVVGVSGTLTACGNGKPTPEDLETVCVEAPQNPQLAVVLQAPRVDYGVWAADKPEEKAWYVMLGNLSQNPLEKGALIEGTVDVPDGVSGSLEFVQNVTVHIATGYADGTAGGLSCDWSLDGGNPYRGLSVPCESGTSCLARMGDSPVSSLSGIENQHGAALISYTRSDEFRTYLMWRPFPSVQYPLAVVEWSWSVSVYHTGAHPPWDFLNWTTDPPVGEARLGKPTTDMPVLTDPVWEK